MQGACKMRVLRFYARIAISFCFLRISFAKTRSRRWIACAMHFRDIHLGITVSQWNMDQTEQSYAMRKVETDRTQWDVWYGMCQNHIFQFTIFHTLDIFCEKEFKLNRILFTLIFDKKWILISSINNLLFNNKKKRYNSWPLIVNIVYIIFMEITIICSLRIYYFYSVILEIYQSSVSLGGKNGAITEGCP